MLKKSLIIALSTYSLSVSATGEFYCEALCEFNPAGYGSSYILLQDEAVNKVEALNKLRTSCTNYEGSYGYLYMNTPTGRPDNNWTQASVQNSCRSL